MSYMPLCFAEKEHYLSFHPTHLCGLAKGHPAGHRCRHCDEAWSPEPSGAASASPATTIEDLIREAAKAGLKLGRVNVEWGRIQNQQAEARRALNEAERAVYVAVEARVRASVEQVTGPQPASGAGA